MKPNAAEEERTLHPEGHLVIGDISRGKINQRASLKALYVEAALLFFPCVEQTVRDESDLLVEELLQGTISVSLMVLVVQPRKCYFQ